MFGRSEIRHPHLAVIDMMRLVAATGSDRLEPGVGFVGQIVIADRLHLMCLPARANLSQQPPDAALLSQGALQVDSRR